MRATLRRGSSVLTRPTNSSMTLGLVPAASTTVGSAISWGMGAQSRLRRMETGTAFTTLDYDTGERFQRLRQQLGVSTFGMNLIVLQPGQRGRIHRHTRQEEVYLVLEGQLTLYVGGEEHAHGEGGIGHA